MCEDMRECCQIKNKSGENMICQSLSFDEVCAASEEYWFPAVICREDQLYRNRFATGLLPPAWRLRRFWGQHREALREEGIELDISQLDAEECAQALYDVMKA